MQITQITIHYEELRSNEYERSNKNVGVTMTAQVEPGDDAVKCRETLLLRAKNAIRAEFGDSIAPITLNVTDRARVPTPHPCPPKVLIDAVATMTTASSRALRRSQRTCSRAVRAGAAR